MRVCVCGITPLCSLPTFYFTVGHALPHTPPNQGWVDAMGRRAFGSFSASTGRRSWWAILRQCTGLCLLVDINHQPYHKTHLWIGKCPYNLSEVKFQRGCGRGNRLERFTQPAASVGPPAAMWLKMVQLQGQNAHVHVSRDLSEVKFRRGCGRGNRWEQ